MTRPSRIAALLSVLVAGLAVVAVASAWDAVKYASDEAVGGYGTRQTCCVAYREFNRVWRPLGNTFCLFYNGTSGLLCNKTENPYTDIRNMTAQAVCANGNYWGTPHVTCLTTKP
jgi:hypothetical protein